MIEIEHPKSGQIRLLDQIQGAIPPNISLVNELSDILQISTDSAYRRIRGETDLTFNEIVALCNRYKVSFDSLISSDSNVVSFTYNNLEPTISSFTSYFSTFQEDLERARRSSLKEKHISYMCAGIPIFRFFQSPLMGAFKMFYWMKSIMNVAELENEKFSQDQIAKELLQMGENVYKHYLHIPSTEIWTDDTINGMLEQIRFYLDSGVFASKDVAIQLCDEVRQMVMTVQKQAEKGQKYWEEGEIIRNCSEYCLYFSEIEFENNCIYVELDQFQTVYLGNLSFGSIKTSNDAYGTATKKWIHNLKKKSNQISSMSETIRYQFFKRCFNKLDLLAEHINAN